jgi:hypothetical protein
MLHHCEAATKKETGKFNHEAHEEHEVYDRKLSEPFVFFAPFVVRKYFVEWRIRDSRAAETPRPPASAASHTEAEDSDFQAGPGPSLFPQLPVHFADKVEVSHARKSNCLLIRRDFQALFNTGLQSLVRRLAVVRPGLHH